MPDKQIAKLIGRIAENLPEMDGDLMQIWIEDPAELQNFLLGLLCPPKVDIIVHFDRSTSLVYPGYVKEVIHPELEAIGPSEYNLANVEHYLTDAQKKRGRISGYQIYEDLKKTDSLKTCFGLYEALVIQEMGIELFRKCFRNKVIFCWKSIVCNNHGSLCVLCVYCERGKVKMEWGVLNCEFGQNHPAARFAS